jgi:DNA-binding response OmpR family regulator
MARFCNVKGRKETEMSLVCRTLVLIEDARTLKLVAQAFPPPKYELEFADTPEEASARAVSNRMDLFIVDSKYADVMKLTDVVGWIKSHLITVKT